MKDVVNEGLMILMKWIVISMNSDINEEINEIVVINNDVNEENYVDNEKIML